jgi:hypothetical protein
MARNGCHFSNDKKHRKQIADKLWSYFTNDGGKRSTGPHTRRLKMGETPWSTTILQNFIISKLFKEFPALFEPEI